MTNERAPSWYAMPPPAGRAYADLIELLGEQVRFLERSAQAYDSGDQAEAKRLAATIRTLVHNTPRSRALLVQLGLIGEHSRRGLWMRDTAAHIPPYAIPAGGQAMLCVMRVKTSLGQTVADYLPRCMVSEIPGTANRTLPFGEWWQGTVIRDQLARSYSRSRVILDLANKDGGTHVDPALPKDYVDVRHGGAMGWRVDPTEVGVSIPTGGATPPAGDAELDPIPATARQIAHEILMSLKGLHPEMVQYEPPPIDDAGATPTP